MIMKMTDGNNILFEVLEILDCIVAGINYKQIANKLIICN